MMTSTKSALDLVTLRSGDALEIQVNGRTCRMVVESFNSYDALPALRKERIGQFYGHGAKGAFYSVELWENGCISLYTGARGSLRRDDWCRVTVHRQQDAN